MPTQMFDTPVLVVGAGPVGAVLALELARHGVPTMVVERSVMPSPEPKSDVLSGRSMELLRRLGLATSIRRRGVAAGHPVNVAWSQGLNRPPVFVWQHPSVEDERRRYEDVNDGSAPVETYQRVQGTLLEELTREAVRRHPLIDLREGWTVADLRLDPEGAVVTVLDPAARSRHTIVATYVAACDGEDSTVRRCLEIPVQASSPRTPQCSVTFTSTDPVLRRYGPAFITIVDRGLSLVSRDEATMWTAHVTLPADEPLTVDPMALVRDRLGVDFVVDKVYRVSQWEGSLAIAARYRKGHVYLVGDAAHRYHPVGGFGVNTGIGDAVDLGWKLAAAVAGWAGSDLLDSYEIERRPAALLHRELCSGLQELRRRYTRLSENGLPREHLAGILAEEMHQADNQGVHFGQRYGDSPVICHETGDAPQWHRHRITPTTWPGGRVPAVRLSGGGQLFDRFGVGFTLVDLSASGVGAPLVRDATARGIPMVHLHVRDPVVRACWERDLVLVRPDQHVAWRGDTPPADWDLVLDRVTGNATTRIRDVCTRLAGQTRA